MENVFKVGTLVQHKKGSRYLILDFGFFYEKDCSICYKYIDIQTRKTWVRCQEEMEDGRFILVDFSVSERETSLDILKEYIKRYQNVLLNIKKDCQHDIKKTSSEGATCVICKEDFGWYCNDSPDHVCHYYSENGVVKLSNGVFVEVPVGHDNENESVDWCIFCGSPEERK